MVRNENVRYWMCTGNYGNPTSNQKKHAWTLLKRLVDLSSLPWLCFGDFNKVLNLNEKIKGNEKLVDMVAEFREDHKKCELVDMRFTKYSFTWPSRRFGPHLTQETLD